jgi:hypothetical protein
MVLIGWKGISRFQPDVLGRSDFVGKCTIADVPDYVLVNSKPDKFSGNDFKGLSLTTVA